MANDCLVTKLKSVVDNDNLFYLNKILFNVDSNEQIEVFNTYKTSTVKLTQGVTLYRVNDTLTIVGPNETQIPAGTYKALGNGKILLSDYQEFNNFGISWRSNTTTKGVFNAVASMPLTQAYFNANTDINERIEQTKKQADKSILTRLDVNGTNIHSIGTLAEFAKLFDAKFIVISNSPSFRGLTDLALFPSLEKISVTNAIFNGSIEDLVAAFVSNGRASGTIQLYKNSVTITFEGNPLDSSKWYDITWNGTSNITVTEAA